MGMRIGAITLFLILSLAGCGGGGGDSTSISNTPSAAITSNDLIKYTGGEVLTYDFTYNAKYSDGSGLVDVAGKETSYIYGWSFPDVPYDTIKLVSAVEAGAVSSSVNNTYYYGSSGDLIHYTTGNEGFYTNQVNNLTGYTSLPGTFSLGMSWTTERILYRFEDQSHYGKRTFTVISKETINVPFGSVEAFKINYRDVFEQIVGPYITTPTWENSLIITGTVWINPQIGIIKINETIDPQEVFLSFTYILHH